MRLTNVNWHDTEACIVILLNGAKVECKEGQGVKHPTKPYSSHWLVRVAGPITAGFVSPQFKNETDNSLNEQKC